MTHVAEDKQVCGRAKVVLVAGKGDNQKAVISTNIARRIKRVGKRRLRFRGTVKFADSVKRHVRNVLLPIVDGIVCQLGLPERCFEISGDS